MQEMTIDRILICPMHGHGAVVLKEKDADLYMIIFMGPAEADPIAVKLQGLTTARPSTHDLLATAIETLGGLVTFVLLGNVHNNTLRANIVVQVGDHVTEFDSRPCDAIALAVGVEVPIYAEESLLDEAGWLPEDEGDMLLLPDPDKRQNRKQITENLEEELQRMSAFTEFINTLDLEDFCTERPR